MKLNQQQFCSWTGKRNDHSDFPPKYDLRARDRRSTLHRFQPKMKVVNCMQSTCNILHTVSKIFCVFFFTCLFRACITCVISMQYGGFAGKKHACNAAIPVACAVLIVCMYTPHLEILVRALMIEHHFDVIRKIVSNLQRILIKIII